LFCIDSSSGSGAAQSEEEALRAQIAKLEPDARDALEERSSLVWQVRHPSYQALWVDQFTQKPEAYSQENRHNQRFSFDSRGSSSIPSTQLLGPMLVI
jgi:hypothetical protein